MTTEDKIFEFADNNNLIAGIGNADSFEYIRDVLEKGCVPFSENNIEKRINPKLTMKDAESFICIGLNYKKKILPINDNAVRGNISMGAVGRDYHLILNDYLKHIESILKTNNNVKCISFCDTGPFVDREIAKRCGLGWTGKNRSVINKRFGSMFFIGYVITNVKLKPSSSFDYDYSECGECNKCIKACPGNALTENGFDYKKCISYLTQCKTINDINDFKILNRQIYGCDICQLVCHFNKETETDGSELNDDMFPDLNYILNLTNKEFNEKYKNTACGWRGKKVLQRNAVIALGNSNNEKAYDMLEKAILDKREDIKNTALKAMKIYMED